MSILVTLSLLLPDWWGADDAWKNGGYDEVKELLWEDITSFAEDAAWKIEKVQD